MSSAVSFANLQWQDITAAALTLFFVMDPLGNVPVFNAVLANYSSGKRALIVARELVLALLILLGFLFAGNQILSFLGINQSSLSIAGGILLFIISLRMIFPKPAGEQNDVVEDPFLVPLAIPMVAGPSTIAVLLLMSSSQPERILEWSVALVMAWIGTTVLLVASPYLMRVLGNRGSRALERLMGMILVILATQLLMNGIREFLQSL